MGAIRIPHRVRPCIAPCSCGVDRKMRCCAKGYCPCRKAGVYCGELCKCCDVLCDNSPVDEREEKDGNLILSKEELEIAEKLFNEEGLMSDTLFDMDDVKCENSNSRLK